MKGDLERITAEVAKIKDSIQEECDRVHGGVRLDINLEKSRIKDETVHLHSLVKEANARIDDEISRLQERNDQMKTDLTKTLGSMKIHFIFSLFMNTVSLQREHAGTYSYVSLFSQIFYHSFRFHFPCVWFIFW